MVQFINDHESVSKVIRCEVFDDNLAKSTYMPKQNVALFLTTVQNITQNQVMQE